MYFTPKLSWSVTLDKLSLQATKASHNIFRYQKKFGNIGAKDTFKIFDATVKPILCYASSIWGHSYNKKVETTHIKFCKRYCLLYNNCPDAFALSECGRLPLCTTYMYNCIKYWLHLLRLEPHRYPKQCYDMLFKLDNAGRDTWATSVKQLLYSFDFGYVWLAQGAGDHQIFLNTFKQRLIDCYSQKIHSEIESTSKGKHYQNFKSLVTVEKYLSINLNYDLKKVLANFRCSCHQLMIEKGRHLGIDRELRYCPLCLTLNVRVVEDELHFFLYCNFYENIRKVYFLPKWLQNRTSESFYDIMSSKDQDCIFRIARYLLSAFKVTQDILDP